MTDTQQREKRHAALYFSPKNSKAFKELAARVRSDGGRTTCVWSNKWRGAESILKECRAIVIETGCAHADDIVEAYRRYANDVEIHFADSNGEFEETAPVPAEDEFVVSDELAEETLASCTDEGATDEEEHDDSDTASDSVVEAEDGGSGDDPADPDSDGEDAGVADVSGEAEQEEPVDPERTASD